MWNFIKSLFRKRWTDEELLAPTGSTVYDEYTALYGKEDHIRELQRRLNIEGLDNRQYKLICNKITVLQELLDEERRERHRYVEDQKLRREQEAARMVIDLEIADNLRSKKPTPSVKVSPKVSSGYARPIKSEIDIDDVADTFSKSIPERTVVHSTPSYHTTSHSSHSYGGHSSHGGHSCGGSSSSDSGGSDGGGGGGCD